MLRIVNIENGTVRGLPAADPRVTSFKGIPFAAPPIGEDRWRAPQPCADWDGVRDAFAFAPISVQDTPGLGTDIYCREWHVDPDIPMSEDCLYLNVWTNAKSADERLPVLVWFFGGGFQWGYTAEMEFDGERLARRGIVVVSVNYRLAALGFLAHPEITGSQPDAPANFGSLDQQAGLRWVVRNIAAFGGDPGKITIAGQSAGGMSVMSQMTCPDNNGLFQRAVVMSGMIRSPYMNDPFVIPKTLSEAERAGIDFFEFLGVRSLAEARELDVFFIRDRYADYAKNHPRFAVVVDGRFCVEDPYSAFLNGRRARVPVMAGNTEDEFVAGIDAQDEEQLKDQALAIFGDRASRFLDFEAAHSKRKEGYAPVSGIECAVKAALLAEAGADDPNPCYYYRFAPEIPGEDRPGTFHSVDLWFFFETLSKSTRPYRGWHYDLARR
ncbi:MAG: carboxylesterase family protein, partial [Clostridiales bacterium]|nr:carboxylesterase family protein [Clostridiales bacterium]